MEATSPAKRIGGFSELSCLRNRRSPRRTSSLRGREGCRRLSESSGDGEKGEMQMKKGGQGAIIILLFWWVGLACRNTHHPQGVRKPRLARRESATL
eukprot:2966332-Pleurochrysis_carterae.AAC.1